MGGDEDRAAAEATHIQLQHFTKVDPRCRALQLPDGLMLRYTLSHSLYFYLRTGVINGKITTQVFASDSPYDREKTRIGEVQTPMFEPQADFNHLERLKKLLHSWVDFVKDEPDTGEDFKAFSLNSQL